MKFLLVSTAVGDTRQPRYTGQVVMKQAMFAAPFLSLWRLLGRLGGCRTFLLFQVKEKWPYGLSRLCTGLQLQQLPVIPHLLLCRSPIATGLEGRQ